MDLIRAGRAVLFRAPRDDKPHLWLIVTDPDGKPARVAAVMLRTAKPYTDETVVLQPGDHPFVRHLSSVDYSSVQLFRVKAIQTKLSKGVCHFYEDMSPSLLRRVQQGLLASPRTVIAMKEYCRSHLGSHSTS